MTKSNLREQLFVVWMIILGIMVVSLGIILPNKLIPIYETNVYNYLKQPLSFLQSEDDIKENTVNTEVAYLYIVSSNTVSISDNLSDIIDIRDMNKLLSHFDLTKENGKFIYKRNTYYYVTNMHSKDWHKEMI